MDEEILQTKEKLQAMALNSVMTDYKVFGVDFMIKELNDNRKKYINELLENAIDYIALTRSILDLLFLFLEIGEIKKEDIPKIVMYMHELIDNMANNFDESKV